MKISFLLSVIIALAVTCMCSCRRTIPCRDEAISLAFNGFDTLSLSQVILIKHKKGTGFIEVIDSLFSGTAYSQLTVNQDGYLLNDMTYGVITPGFDWIVYVVKTHRTYKIKEVTFHKTKGTRRCWICEGDCRNDCSYYVNDSLHEHKGSIYDRLYIHIYK